MLSSFLLYLFLTEILIWFIRSQHIFDHIFIGALKSLRGCRICLGTWVSGSLYYFFSKNVYLWPNDNVIYYLANLVIISVIVTIGLYLLTSGWERQFGVTIIK